MSNPLPLGAVAWEEASSRFATGAVGRADSALEQEFGELMEAIVGVLDGKGSGSQPSSDAVAACASLLDHIVCASKGADGPR